MIHYTKEKGWKTSILKLTTAETIYGVWRYRNNKSYGNSVDNTQIVANIIDMIIYNAWYSGKIREHIAKLMMV